MSTQRSAGDRRRCEPPVAAVVALVAAAVDRSQSQRRTGQTAATTREGRCHSAARLWRRWPAPRERRIRMAVHHPSGARRSERANVAPRWRRLVAAFVSLELTQIRVSFNSDERSVLSCCREEGR